MGQEIALFKFSGDTGAAGQRPHFEARYDSAHSHLHAACWGLRIDLRRGCRDRALLLVNHHKIHLKNKIKAFRDRPFTDLFSDLTTEVIKVLRRCLVP